VLGLIDGQVFTHRLLERAQHRARTLGLSGATPFVDRTFVWQDPGRPHGPAPVARTCSESRAITARRDTKRRACVIAARLGIHVLCRAPGYNTTRAELGQASGPAVFDATRTATLESAFLRRGRERGDTGGYS